MDSNENGNNSTLEQSPKINGNDTHSDTTKEQDASVPLEDTQNDFNWDDEEFGKEQVNSAIAVTTDNLDDDEFGDFDDFATPIEAKGDDDFGDFGDFETTEELQQESFADQDDKDNDDEIPKTPTKTEEYVRIDVVNDSISISMYWHAVKMVLDTYPRSWIKPWRSFRSYSRYICRNVV